MVKVWMNLLIGTTPNDNIIQSTTTKKMKTGMGKCFKVSINLISNLINKMKTRIISVIPSGYGHKKITIIIYRNEKKTH